MLTRNLAVLALILTTAATFAGGANELETAKEKFAKSDKSEGARTAYVVTLARILHEDMAEHMRGRGNPELAGALSAELGQYPVPKNSDSKALSKLLVGRWQSPRHTYIFQNDGTWRLSPENGTTHGNWHIKGNQFVESYYSEDNSHIDSETTETIILLNKEYFVFGDAQGVYLEYRL